MTLQKIFRPRLLLSAALICASLPVLAAETQYVKPNENLKVEGVLPIEQSMADTMARYTDFRLRNMVQWHPAKRAVLLTTRSKGSTMQLHLLQKPMGEMEQLTDFPDPVRNARFQPKKGQFIVFEKDDGGNEAAQIYRLDLDTRKITLLTDPNEKHSMGQWDHQGKTMLMSSIQLDKTAGGKTRTDINTDIYVLDPLKPESKRKLASLPGGGWGQMVWSNDDKQIAAIERISANSSRVWLIDAASGERKQILPKDDKALVSYAEPKFTRDGKSLLLSSDGDGEFMQLIKVDLKTLNSSALSAHISWDISDKESNPFNDLLATTFNRDGLNELRIFDTAKGKELEQPKVPIGAVSRLQWLNGDEVGFDLNNAQSQGEVYSYNVKTKKLEQWTTPQNIGVDTSRFRAPEIVRWKSFDGLMISGLLSKPPAQNSNGQKFEGKRPVLINIHGGPEGQAQIGFLGRNNYLVNELGIAMIQPNVRGSSGFGKTFLKLDNGMLRENSVKDIGALLDWIATQPDLDPKRVAVIGGSYGGYMSLAVSTHYSDRIVGAIDVVGISHFVTFLNNTETYRRDLRRVEYGDERDPAMRAFLEKISPLNNAEKIKKPLFVVQGKNDPRVPYTEAEQIVARVRKNDVPVWYLMADNEGHGFTRKPNQDFYLYSVSRFLQEYLLK